MTRQTAGSKRASFLRVVLTMLISVFALTGLASGASARTIDTLQANDSLMPNESIMSLNQAYQLSMQGDGNLVIYRVADMKALWSSKTYGHPGAFAAMQGDGNLVVYLNATPLFSSKTAGNPGARLVLQGDGNLVIYSSANVALFASATAQGLPAPTMPLTDTLQPNKTLQANQSIVSNSGKFQLIMQADGNLVLYRLDDAKVLWSSKTYGNNGAFAAMQGDGNLVIYLNGKTLFSTKTFGNPGARLVMQDDGNLVIYSTANKALFASGTRQLVCSTVVQPVFGGDFEHGTTLFSGDDCFVFVRRTTFLVPFAVEVFDPSTGDLDICTGIPSYQGQVAVQACK